MLNKNPLAKSFVDDYYSLGLAIKVSEDSLESFDGETVVVLDNYVVGDEIVGLSIYSNDTHVGDYSYSDDDFNEKFLQVMSTELNF